MVGRYGLPTLGGYALGGPALGGAVAAYGALKNPYEMVKTLTALEGFVQKTSTRISNSVDRFIKGTEVLASKVNASTKDIQARLMQAHLEKQKEDEEQRKIKVGELSLKSHAEPGSYAHNSKLLSSVNVSSAANAKQDKLDMSVSKFNARLSRLTHGNLSTVAPNTVSAIANKQAQIAKALVDAYPKDPVLNPLGVHKSNYKPSQTDLDNWETLHKVLTNPMSVIKKFEEGKTIGKLEVDALKQHWPELYNKTVATIMEKLPSIKRELTNKEKSQLSVFVGQDFDTIVSPQFVGQVQKIYASEAQKKQAASMVGAGKSMEKMIDTKKSASEKLIK